jgi:hypothetical protein
MNWHRWFAWRPVPLLYEINECPGFSWVPSGHLAWMQYVERREQNGRCPQYRGSR